MRKTKRQKTSNIIKKNYEYSKPSDRNTHDTNVGNFNSGKHNTGNYNCGNHNAGHFNTGSCNCQRYNAGNLNHGTRNSGNGNYGNLNAGSRNYGSRNTGNGNHGDSNTGDFNIGDCNIGDFNHSNYSFGCFNTEAPKFMLFNKPTDWTYEDWIYSFACIILKTMPTPTDWIELEDMTDIEKIENPNYDTTGGYLKILDETELRSQRQAWWNDLSDKKQNTIKSIPNFDSKIFKEITGIEV